MSIASRFATRENRAMVITVPFPLDAPAIEFTVSRIGKAVMREATIDGIAMTNRVNVPENSPKRAFEELMWTSYCLVPQLKHHITDWKSLTDDKLPAFSRKELDEMVDEFSVDEMKILGYCYFQAVSESDKKNLSETNTAPVS
jgi:hypothetical protein